MEKFPSFNQRPKERIKKIVMAISALVLLGSHAKGQQNEKDTILSQKAETEHHIDTSERNNPFKDESYITRDGNHRYYHNPAGYFIETQERKIDYSLGATKCPFESDEEMKMKTRIPESLTETDFFTNYVNAKFETKDILEDKNTGNKYYNFSEYDSNLNAVPIEGEYHWNIHRFLIDPEYQKFHIKKDEARRNTLFDMYRYFLYQEKGDREMAWKKANEFVSKNVDTIVNSEYANWANKNYPHLYPNYYKGLDSNYYVGDMNLFSKSNNTGLPEDVILFNYEVFNGEKKDTSATYSAKEIEDVLINYNIVYRKKSPEDARTISHAAIVNADKGYRKWEEELKLEVKIDPTKEKELKRVHNYRFKE